MWFARPAARAVGRLVPAPDGRVPGGFSDAEAVILEAPGHPEISSGLDGFDRVVHRTPIRHDETRSPTLLDTSVSSQLFSAAYTPLILLYADMTDHGLASRIAIWKLRK